MPRLLYDYHTHTRNSMMGPFPHAFGTIMDNVEAAHKAGLEAIAITDHGPGHIMYGVRIKQLDKMRRDIAEAQEKYPDMKIYLGVEANFTDTPNGLDVKPEQFALYDFVNAGYHYGVTKSGMIRNWLYNRHLLPKFMAGKLREYNTRIAVKALMSNDIKIITHPGDKGPFDMEAICQACEDSNTLMELNARHRHLTVDEIKLASKYNVNFVIGSDAHKTKFIGLFKESVAKAREAGLDVKRIVNYEE